MPLKVALFVMSVWFLHLGMIVPTSTVRPHKVDELSACRQKLCGPLQSKWLHLSYTETSQHLSQSAEPWQTTTQSSTGSGWFTNSTFEKSDTSRYASGRMSVSNSAFDSTSLLIQPGGDTTLTPVTKKIWLGALFQSARYSPVIIIDYFSRHKSEASKRIDSGLAIYSLKVDNSVVRLAIRLSDTLVDWVQTLETDDLLGDAEDVYRYKSYITVDGLSLPDSTETEKADGKLKGAIRILTADIVNAAPTLIRKPADFKFIEEKKKLSDVRQHKFSSHIYLVDLIHADCRSMLVEFPDYFLVIDAPVSSENGELVIREARKIAPAKPIKYFTFGHFHSSFIGGIRPFISRGATILTRAEDTPYVNFLASESHALQPDSLYLHPLPTHIQEIGDSLTISDGGYQMKIYYIGKKSRHSNDYVIFYFPEENVVWDDDLAWVKQKGPVDKAIDRQAGLVNAIKDLGLHPQKVIQSWPLVEYGIKTMIPFDDLEASMNAKGAIDVPLR